MKERLSLKRITVAGLLAAAVCAASLISIPIPTPIDNTRLHMGNIMCILSGLLMGGFLGGCSAGIGSFFFDLLNPQYIASAPFTLVFKFFIGFIAGSIAFAGGKNGRNTASNILGGVLGSVVYIILYLGKSYIENRLVYHLDISASFAVLAPKAVASLVNGAIAVIVAVPLAAFIKAAMKRANLSLQ